MKNTPLSPSEEPSFTELGPVSSAATAPVPSTPALNKLLDLFLASTVIAPTLTLLAANVQLSYSDAKLYQQLKA